MQEPFYYGGNSPARTKKSDPGERSFKKSERYNSNLAIVSMLMVRCAQCAVSSVVCLRGTENNFSVLEKVSK